MGETIKDGRAMVAGLSPELVEGRFAFATFADDAPDAMRGAAIAMFREREGLSLIVPAELVPDAPVMRMITLTVASSLEGVGLTAAASSALATENIPCNMVAAFHHDHIFVPEDCADRALSVLIARAARDG